MGSDTSTGFSSEILHPQLKPIVDSTQKRNKVIVIAGPTAAGKTKLSLIISKALEGEIISCDSMQIYRNCDIGSAKPTIQERLSVPHHLIDIKEINEPFNVVDFHREAYNAFQEISNKNRISIFVGGSGFYIQTLLFGPPQGPPSDKAIRERLEEDCERFGVELLYGKLVELDSDYASTITVQDRQKILRALEIITLSHKRVSDFPKPSMANLPKEIDFRCWFIYYPKEILYKRIEERCDEMIREGLLNEVIALRQKGLEDNPPAKNSIGYRQALEFLESSQSPDDWNYFIAKFKQATRRYAKRQLTWFRKEPLFRWLDLSECNIERAAEIIIQDFEQN